MAIIVLPAYVCILCLSHAVCTETFSFRTLTQVAHLFPEMCHLKIKDINLAIFNADRSNEITKSNE
jgi:hypothetical protein